MDDAVRVLMSAPGDDDVGVHDDADEARIVVKPQLEDRQTRLRGDRDRHRIGDVEATGTIEFLAREEQRRQRAQSLAVGLGAPAEKGGGVRA